MEGFQRCPNCNKFGWFGEKFGRNRHTCPPLWEVRIHETRWEEDWSDIYATDAEDAAEVFAESYDSDGEYTIIQSGSAVVEVRKKGDDAVTIWDISAESVPEYTAHARAVPSEQCGGGS